MKKTYLLFMLHTHLPFIRHPHYEWFLEEEWLFEAMTEVYIPMIYMWEKLWQMGIASPLTISLSPSLCEMLADPLLQNRYRRHLKYLKNIIEQERQKCSPNYARVISMYRDKLDLYSQIFEAFGGKLLEAYFEYQQRGQIEIITCGATHGFLPLMKTFESRRAQIEIGIQNYHKHLRSHPKGIWLPECAYCHKVEDILASFGIQYFFAEFYAVDFENPSPESIQPVYVNPKVAVFPRNYDVSMKIWSNEAGYPGNAHYREFYRDLGFEAEYVQIDGIKRPIGLKYYKITGRDKNLSEKHIYEPEKALEQAEKDAENFLNHCSDYAQKMQHLDFPLIICALDTELFGHWWYEGPHFLESLLEKIGQYNLELVTPSQFLNLKKNLPHSELFPSSWGERGCFRPWINPKNDWLHSQLHELEYAMLRLCQAFQSPNPLEKRCLDQATRELLLAQSSDWPFIINANSHVEYAIKRFEKHVFRFQQLRKQIINSTIDTIWLAEIENEDNIFPELDYRSFRSINR